MHTENPAITVVCALGVDDAPRVSSLLQQIAGQRGVEPRVVLIDGTRHGIGQRPEATVLRCATWAEGRALIAALPHVHTPWVAWWDPCAHALPNRLERTLAWLEEHPGAELATTAYFISEQGENYLAQVEPGAMGDSPGAFWTSGVVVAASRLEELVPWVGFPARLALYRQLLAEGCVTHLPAPLFHVPATAYVPEQAPARARAATLARQASHVERSAITVISLVESVDDALPALLGSITAQELPDGAVTTLLVDRTGDGAVQSALDGTSLPGPLQVLHAPSGGFATAANAALAMVDAPLVLFVDSTLKLAPDAVLEHLRAHRQHSARPSAVQGEVVSRVSSIALDRVIENRPSSSQDGAAGLRLLQVSIPTRALVDVGGFDERFVHAQGADQDLGLRLESAGIRVTRHPRARAVRALPWTLEALAAGERARAEAMPSLLDAHPDRMGTTIAPETSQSSCEQLLQDMAPDITRAWTAAGALAQVNLGSLSRGFPEDAALAEHIQATLTGHLAGLSRAWAHEGVLAGLRREGISTLGEVLRRHPFTLSGATGRVTLACPDKGDPLSWRTALTCFLEHHSADDDVTLALLALDVPAPVLLRGLRDETRRFRLHHAREPASVVIVQGQLPAAQLPRLLAAADCYLCLGGHRDADLGELAQASGLDIERIQEWVTTPTPDNRAPVPYPLATRAPLRLLAWPDWSSEEELAQLWDWVRPLAGRRDVALCLRWDPLSDAPADEALPRLKRTFTEVLGEGAELEVLLVDEVLDELATRALIDTMDAALQLPSSTSGPRRSLLAAARSTLSTPGAVSRWEVRIDQVDIPHTAPVLAHVG